MVRPSPGDTSLPTPAHPLAPLFTVEALATHVEGNLDGEAGAIIMGVSSIEEAEKGDIVFAENPRFLHAADRCHASAILAPLDAPAAAKPLIRVENPRYAFARILELFAPRLNAPPGIHPTAILGSNVRLGAEVHIGANVVIADNTVIGDRSVILTGVCIGEECALGNGCLLFPNVTLYAGVTLKDRVIIHSGTVVGSDGFGYMRLGDRSVKIPQIGVVEIGEDVEIGANCTIDRSKTGSTVIGARTKIDNLVHIAHNVKIGTDCIIVAQVGIAGSCQIGRGVVLAGQVGLKDHLIIGDGATVRAQAGVIGDVAAGEDVSGYPARPHMEKQRQYAAVNKLPDYLKRIRALERANADLDARNARLESLVYVLAEKLGVPADFPADDADNTSTDPA